MKHFFDHERVSCVAIYRHRLVARAWRDDARISAANGKARGKAGRVDDLYGLTVFVFGFVAGSLLIGSQ